jgi:hypothetical protein
MIGYEDEDVEADDGYDDYAVDRLVAVGAIFQVASGRRTTNRLSE